MKKLFNAIFCTIFLIVSSYAQEFTKVFPKVATGEIVGLDVHENGIGYAVTSCFALLYTDNYGQVWEDRELSTMPGKLFIFPDSDGSELIIDSGRNVVYSNNSGGSWTDITPNGSLLHNTIVILPGGRIVLPARDSKVYISDDRGMNWTVVEEDFSNAAFTQSTFVDNNAGWIATFQGEIWKTTDGGLSWEKVHEEMDSNNYNDLVFFDDTLGFRSISGTLFRTTDAGINWSDYYVGFEVNSHILAVNDTTLFSHSGGASSISMDRGMSWTPFQNDFFPVFNNAISSSNWIWRFGLNKSIHASSDFGQNWSDQTQTIKSAITDIAFDDKENGVVVLNDGLTLASSDGGQNWNFKASPNVNYNGVIYNESGEILMLSNRTITKTADYINYDTVFTTTLFNAKFHRSGDEKAIFIAGQSKVLKTTDNGNTWDLLLDNPSRTFRTFAAPNENVLYLGGASGEIIKSTDGGQTWQESAGASSAFVRAMYFFDANNGIIMSNDSIRVTQDGAMTFTGVNARPQNVLNFIMEDEMTGIAVGSSSPGSNQGYVYQTSDGWKNFTRTLTACQHLHVITKKESSGDYWFAGNGGHIVSANGLVSSTADVVLPEIEELQIYPNPSSGQVYIEKINHFSPNSVLNIFDFQGKLKMQSNYNNVLIGGVKLPPGMYVFQLRNQKFIAISKVVVLE